MVEETNTVVVTDNKSVATCKALKKYHGDTEISYTEAKCLYDYFSIALNFNDTMDISLHEDMTSDELKAELDKLVSQSITQFYKITEGI